jgi:hypothetical protein
MSDAELLIEEIKTLPEGRVAEVLDFVEFIKRKETRAAEEGDDSWFKREEECPICAKHRDPVTGELRFNTETMAAIEEGRAMMRGEIPAQRFSSIEELLADLRS